MVCMTLLRLTLRADSLTLRESVRFSATVTFLMLTVFLYTVLYCRGSQGNNGGHFLDLKFKIGTCRHNRSTWWLYGDMITVEQ